MHERFQDKVDTDADHFFSVNGSRYVAVENDSKQIASLSQEFSLATVFILPKDDRPSVTLEWIQASLDNYRNNDDLFDNAFLSTVILHGAEETAVLIEDEARQYLREQGAGSVVCTLSPSLSPGPHAVVRGQLRDVWKLVDDTQGTCMVTLKPQINATNAFETLQLQSSDNRFASFALPSRVKSRAMSSSALAGLRVLVKDNINLKGIKTSVGNTAFYDTYPPCQESAECVQSLIDQGVAILGKTKMNSFATWEEPIEYIDYQAPWNPRADGYQSPGGSSSGIAAAVAMYDWLDIAIGTDTWGSVTRPALWCGCYGLRPSFGAVSAVGIEPCCQTFDTAGVLGRDLKKCRDFAAEWLSPNVLDPAAKAFKLVIWPTDFWKTTDAEQIDIARRFARQIVSHLDAAYEEVSFEQAWLASPPVEADGCSLSEFIDEAVDTQDYDAHHNYNDFRERYHQLTGHAPYVSPPNQKAWEFAQTVSKEARDVGFERMNIYKKWFERTILAATNDSVLIVMPLDSVAPRYRDQLPNFQRFGPGINTLGLAPALACPIGEIPYHSRITDREEKLPFAVAVMGSRGTDLQLMDTIHDVLKEAVLPTVVNAGKNMFK